VSGTEVQLALRKWYGVLTSAPFVTIVAVVSLLGTFYLVPQGAGLPVMLRILAKQVATSALSSAVASLVILFGVRAMRDSRVPVVLRHCLSGLVASVPVFAVVLGIEAVSGEVLWQSGDLMAVALNVVLTVTGIALVIGVFVARRPVAVVETVAPQRGVTFLKRLPVDLGRALIRVSALDHYVEVQTSAGTTLLLMRFADALEELEGCPGGGGGDPAVAAAGSRDDGRAGGWHAPAGEPVSAKRNARDRVAAGAGGVNWRRPAGRPGGLARVRRGRCPRPPLADSPGIFSTGKHAGGFRAGYSKGAVIRRGRRL
jgi:hypothetical protein